MNTQQEAVAFWKFLEGRGVRPSIRKVVAMMRLSGIRVNETDAYEWLANFAAAAPHPKAHRSKIPAQGQHSDSTSNSTPAAQIQHSEQHSDSDSTALYAGDKVSLVSKKEPSAPAPALFDSEPVEAKPKRATPVPRLDLRTPAQITADEVLVALQPVIKPALKGMTWTAWRSRNRAAIADIAAAGCDADEIVAAWEAGSERRGYPVLTMRWIAEDLNRSVPAERLDTSSALPTLTELIAAGKVERINNAAVIAERPAWFNRQLAAMA